MGKSGTTFWKVVGLFGKSQDFFVAMAISVLGIDVRVTEQQGSHLTYRYAGDYTRM